MSTLNNPRLQVALDSARKGLAGFPLKPRSKVPATPNGLKDATTDEQRLINWFKFNPEYNLGIRTGNGLYVVDVDGDKLTPESQAFINSLEPTYTVATGRGAHLYYRGNGRNFAGKLPGIDGRGEGGYVVAPSSIHPDGSEYQVISNIEIAPIPQSVIELMQRRSTSEVRSTERATGDEDGGVTEGGRNQYLASVAGKMQRDDTLTFEGLMGVNEKKCAPPLPDSEVLAIYDSITRYAPTAPVQVPDNDPLILRASSFSQVALDGLADKEKVKGLSTGFPKLDNLLGGGYRLGEFLALTALTKAGKSSLLHQLIYNLVSKGVPVGYASREMRPAEEVLPNMLSIHFKENAWKAEITDGRRAQYKTEVENWPLYFSPGYGHFPVENITAWVESLVGIGVRYFYLDHLHYSLLDPEDWKAAVKLAQELKSLVLKHNVCIVVVIQPGKLMEGQKLSFSNLRGGAGVGQALDCVLLLERHKVEGTEVPYISRLTLDIARHKLAKLGHMFFEYDSETTGFFEVEPHQAENPQPAGYEA